MDWTILLTVVSGVATFVVGQVFLKLVLEPVTSFRQTVGRIAHSLVNRANVIANPGVPTKDVIQETSSELRALSADLEMHLYAVPAYRFMRMIFRLPKWDAVLKASGKLIGLSNSIFEPRPNIYEVNAKRVESIRDHLFIYQSDDERWPKDESKGVQQHGKA